MFCLVQLLDKAEIGLLLLTRFLLLGLLEVFYFVFKSKNCVFILRLFPSLYLFSRLWILPFVLNLFNSQLELLLSVLKSHYLRVLHLNVRHDLTLHLSLMLQLLLGFT